jgi:importin subunit beta-1
MIRATRQNREFSPRTTETARWAREQAKRQVGGVQGSIQT